MSYQQLDARRSSATVQVTLDNDTLSPCGHAHAASHSTASVLVAIHCDIILYCTGDF